MLVIITEHKPIDRGNWRRTWSWKITSKCMLFALRNLLVCKIYIKKRSIPWSPCTREISDFSVQKRIKVIWRTFVPAILSQNDSRQTWHFFLQKESMRGPLPNVTVSIQFYPVISSPVWLYGRVILTTRHWKRLEVGMTSHAESGLCRKNI